VKWLLALLIALSLALQPQPAAAIGGPSNIVIAVNHSHGRLAIRANLKVNREPGMVAAPQNFAFARASCTDCQTIAVALQLNFANRNAPYIAPQNVAVAVNGSCSRCATIALAYQVFYTVDDPTRLPEGISESMRELDVRLRDISTDPTISFADALSRIQATIADFMTTATSLDVQRSSAE
jgi:putative peptide zinc metalloprotease protein